MAIVLLAACLLLTIAVNIPSSREVKGTLKGNVESATQLLQFSKHNECISNAIGSLHTSCQRLSFDEKSRMALKLTNCLLEKARKPTFECSPNEDIEECTSLLRGDSWTSYTNFYTHIDNLCYYYRSLVWEEKTEKLVVGLSETAESTRTMLNENLESTREILKSQRTLKEDLEKSVELQDLLREGLHQNSQLFSSMASNMSTSLSHFHNEIMTHYGSIHTIFKSVDTALTHISNMQSFILDEVVYGYASAMYFSVVMGIVFLLGTTEIFLEARNRSLVMLIINAVLEKAIKMIGLDRIVDIYKLRWVFLLIVGILLVASYREAQRNRRQAFEDLIRMTSRIDRSLDPQRIKDMMKSAIKSHNQGLRYD